MTVTALQVAAAMANLSEVDESSPVTSSSEVAASALADAWVVKEAIRQPSSEQQEWTLKVADGVGMAASSSQTEEIRPNEDWGGSALRVHL
jgi:heat shock protein HslJ